MPNSKRPRPFDFAPRPSLDAVLARGIIGFDQALRTLAGAAVGERPSPARAVALVDLAPDEQTHVAGLMRVNHAGEVCAQALYDGQALTATSPRVAAQMQQAAQEERDHLAWCEERLQELEAKPSLLNPVWYVGSFALGAAAGLLGDKVSLGFVEAVEDQVVQHLEEHQERLPTKDERTRAVLDAMKADEARHGAEALAHGGAEFPAPVKGLMRQVAKVMTWSSYRI